MRVPNPDNYICKYTFYIVIDKQEYLDTFYGL